MRRDLCPARRAVPAPSRWRDRTGDRRRRLRRPGPLLVGLVAGLLTGGPVALALWSAGARSDQLSLAEAAVGFAVTYDGQHQAAASVTDVVGLTLGPTEAAAVLAAPEQAVALPFTIDLAVYGVYGLSFEVTLPQFTTDSVLARSTLSVFPVGPAGCTVAAADAPDTPVTNAAGHIVGLAPPTSPNPPGTTASQAWCLVVRYVPTVYRASTEVTGQNILGTELAPAESDWSATFDPAPGDQPPATITLTHYLDRAGRST